MAEMISLLDADRAPLGRIVERSTKLREGEHVLVVHVCVFNSRGELLIQQRSQNKKSYPGFWDVSAAGAVRAGETGREAAVRETREELGLCVTLQDGAAVTLALPGRFDDFFLTRADAPLSDLTVQTEEVQDVRWATREEICAMLHAGEFAPYWESFLRLLFDLNENLGLRE